MQSKLCRYIFACTLVVTVPSSYGASFTLTTNTTNSPKTLAGNETGLVNGGVTWTSSGSNLPVTITGNNATFTNLGTVNQTGTGRIIRDNTGVSNLVVNNGSATNSAAVMQANDADIIQMNKTPASVTLNNYGTMTSTNASAGGAQVVDFNAVLSGANAVNNFAGGNMTAYNADVVRPGVNGTVYNAGTIKSIITVADGSGSDGVDAQNNTGIQITNDGLGIIQGGRHGITGGAANNSTAWAMSVTNNANATIQGDNGAGINLDGFNANQTATVINFGTIQGNGVTGDGDGVDVDGLVSVTNKGTITSLNAVEASSVALSEGISMGGGTVTNSGTIQGLVAAGNNNAVGRGISVVGVDAAGGTREAIYGNTLIDNQAGGLILGQSDSGILVGGPRSGFSVTINNAASATIQGGGTTAAILTGADDDTINNSGHINGNASGKAINMGSGVNKLTISGGAAQVDGDIDGGIGGANTVRFDLGVDNTFSFGNSLLDFNMVDIYSGLVTLSGVSSYTGTTKVTGSLELKGANRLTGSGNLELNGGTLWTSNTGGVDAATFGCLDLTGNSVIDLDGSSLTFGCLGTIGSGDTLAVLDYAWTGNSSYAFRFAGDRTANAAFLALIDGTTINGQAAQYGFDGVFTDVYLAPEPSTFALIGLGGVLVAVIRRRRVQRRRAY